MSAAADPFRHLPELRDAIQHPEESRFRRVDMAVLDARMRSAGHPPDWRRTDEAREATRLEALADRLDDDLWVFGYGSLMWDPAFHFSEVRSALVRGYHRSFCLRSEMGRGSPERPGLMAALDHGGHCHGLAFRIHRELVDAETRVLWSREMVSLAYDPTFVAAETPQGTVEALAFVINPAARNYVCGLGVEESARLIAHAEGLFGANLAYLDNLAQHFRMMNIPDDGFFKLYDLACRFAGRDDVDTSRPDVPDREDRP
jgi:glutathione-specific gamma-glutamylcyclotransferase